MKLRLSFMTSVIRSAALSSLVLTLLPSLSSAQPISVQGDRCVLTATPSEDGTQTEVTIFPNSGEDSGIAAKFTISNESLPLNEGLVSVTSEALATEISASYKSGTLSIRGQGHTDFLETKWVSLSVDPTLERPTKAILWAGIAGIPYQRFTCRFE